MKTMQEGVFLVLFWTDRQDRGTEILSNMPVVTKLGHVELRLEPVKINSKLASSREPFVHDVLTSELMLGLSWRGEAIFSSLGKEAEFTFILTIISFSVTQHRTFLCLPTG